MFALDPTLPVMETTRPSRPTPTPAVDKPIARPGIEDELRILVSAEGVREVDELALFGLTSSDSERTRRKPRHL